MVKFITNHRKFITNYEWDSFVLEEGEEPVHVNFGISSIVWTGDRDMEHLNGTSN